MIQPYVSSPSIKQSGTPILQNAQPLGMIRKSRNIEGLNNDYGGTQSHPYDEHSLPSGNVQPRTFDNRSALYKKLQL